MRAKKKSSFCSGVAGVVLGAIGSLYFLTPLHFFLTLKVVCPECPFSRLFILRSISIELVFLILCLAGIIFSAREVRRMGSGLGKVGLFVSVVGAVAGLWWLFWPLFALIFGPGP